MSPQQKAETEVKVCQSFLKNISVIFYLFINIAASIWMKIGCTLNKPNSKTAG